MTNWKTVSDSISRLRELEAMQEYGGAAGLTKNDGLQLAREMEKLDKTLGGIKEMGGKPDLMFVIDTNKEGIAIKEARRLGVPVIAILDSNCDPESADFPIPGNDDAARAIQLYCELIADAVLDGMTEAQASLGQDLGAAEHIEEVMLQTPVVEEAAPVAAPAAALTDISLVDGIGPKYKAALEAAGVTSLQVMAELTDEKIAEVEAAADLAGKFAAGEWVVQAKEIVSGKPPRAKSDQAAAAKA